MAKFQNLKDKTITTVPKIKDMKIPRGVIRPIRDFAGRVTITPTGIRYVKTPRSGCL